MARFCSETNPPQQSAVASLVDWRAPHSKTPPAGGPGGRAGERDGQTDGLLQYSYLLGRLLQPWPMTDKIFVPAGCNFVLGPVEHRSDC